MALKQQQIQKQHQGLLPLQYQLYSMLELPVIELEEHVRKKIEENPAIEEDISEEPDTAEKKDILTIDPHSISEAERNTPSYKLHTNNSSIDNDDYQAPIVSDVDLHEFLIEQLPLVVSSEQERIIAEYVVGNINSDGYMQRKPEEISDDLLFQLGIDIPSAKIEEIINKIKQLDPVGVCAKDLQECLLIQVERKGEKNSLLYTILRDCFDELSQRQHNKIIKKLHISEQDLEIALDGIKHLNPKPGNGWNSNSIEKNLDYIIPDYILENEDGEFSITLNNKNMPRLRVTPEYTQMLKTLTDASKKNKEQRKAVSFVKEEVEAAEVFIEALKIRERTLLAVMNAIVRHQQEYLLSGDEMTLKPLLMTQIAQETGFDEAVISRVSNNKYIQTDFGTVPLKIFFNKGTFTDTGEAISIREVKAKIQNIINIEDKSNPITDEKLAEMMTSEGLDVARRTIAKYREQLGIPVARLRKKT